MNKGRQHEIILALSPGPTSWDEAKIIQSGQLDPYPCLPLPIFNSLQHNDKKQRIESSQLDLTVIALYKEPEYEAIAMAVKRASHSTHVVHSCKAEVHA